MRWITDSSRSSKGEVASYRRHTRSQCLTMPMLDNKHKTRPTCFGCSILFGNSRSSNKERASELSLFCLLQK